MDDMTFRTVYGRTHSANGWRNCDRNEVVTNGVPGVEHVKIEIRAGAPDIILRAWARWWHDNVRRIDVFKPRDYWGWSAVNDVASSNHLSGTAVDLNATTLAFRRRNMTVEERNTVHRGLALFEGMVNWGGDWSNPIDEMHSELAYPEGDRRNEEFAAKLLRGYLGIYGEPDPDRFPLPLNHFYGPLEGPNESISGRYVSDRPEWIEGLKRWQRLVGIPETGVWDDATKRAAQALQIENGWQPWNGASPDGFVYEGEWNAVVKHGQRPNYDAEPKVMEWADVSQYQNIPVGDAYPHRVVVFRVNNGEVIDSLARENLARAKAMADSGKLDAFGVYTFYRPGKRNFETLKDVVGEPHPKMFAMLDVESAVGSSQGAVTGDVSQGANHVVRQMQEWLGGRRVIGYYNQRADGNLWSTRPDIPFVTPDYGAPKGRPRFPYEQTKFHQYTDRGKCPPWPNGVDMNFYAGSVEDFLTLLGIDSGTGGEPLPPPVPDPKPEPEPEPEPPEQEQNSMSTRITTVTGPGTSAVQFGVGGTDLGIARKLANGKVLFAFGDTFDQFGVGGPGWRSPVILESHTDTLEELRKGVKFDGAIGGNRAKQLWFYIHDAAPWTNGGFKTVLPTDLIEIDGRIYLHVMITRELGDEQWSEIQYSDDGGNTWNLGPKWGKDEFGGDRRHVTFEDGGDGFVYAITTGGLRRDRNALLFRVPRDKILDKNAWQGWGWDGANWGWNRYPSWIFPIGTKFGEMNLRRVEGRWVLAYFDAGAGQVRVKTVANITDNWHTAPMAVIVRNVPHWAEFLDRNNTLGQPYGGYILPGSTLDELHVNVSQWNTVSNWPYHVVQFSARAPR